MNTANANTAQQENEKAELIRAALLAYAQLTIGRERSLCEDLAAQAEEMVEAISQ